MLNKNEQNLLLNVIEFYHTDKSKIELAMSKNIDWVGLIGYITHNRLSGLFYSVMSSNGIMLSSQLNHELSLMKDIQALRVNALRKQIGEITNKLESCEINHVFLKGSVLSGTVYPEGARSSNDIDILIMPKDVTRVGKALKELGYIQGEYNFTTNKLNEFSRQEIIYRRMNWGEVGTYVKMTDLPGLNYTEVDVNISIDWLPSGKENIIEEMICSREKYDVNNLYVPSLRYEDFLIYLCVHLYKEAVLINMVQKLRDYDLYKYVDIYAFLHVFNNKIDWTCLEQRIKSFNLYKECYYALDFARRIFQTLKSNSHLSQLLEAIQPENLDYLDQVFDGADQTLYKWTVPFEKRFLNSKRLKYLVKDEN
jgi:hypothetical protein